MDGRTTRTERKEEGEKQKDELYIRANGYLSPVWVYQKCAYCYLSFVWIKVIGNVIIKSNDQKSIIQIFV